MAYLKKNNLMKKSVARLISCQALCMYYDKNNENKNINEILENINDFYVKRDLKDEYNKNKFDNLYKHNFVYELINGVIDEHIDYDILITKYLQKQDTVDMLDDILLECFRLSCYELKHNLELDKKVIINEYVDIVAEFYDGAYITFANGMIDSLAVEIRGGEKILNFTHTDKINNNLTIDNVENKKTRTILKLKHNN